MSLQQDIYAVEIIDKNGSNYFIYPTKKDAIDSVMMSDFKINKSNSELEQYFEKDSNPFCIEEHNGELYWQWVRREYTNNKLIVPNGKKIPNTFEELRAFMESGEQITTCGQDRSPTLYKVVKVCGEFPIQHESFGIRVNDKERYSIFPSKELAVDNLFNKYLKTNMFFDQHDGLLYYHTDNVLRDSDKNSFKTIKQFRKFMLNMFIEENDGLFLYHTDDILRDYDGDSFKTIKQYQTFMTDMIFYLELENKFHSIIRFEKGRLV